MTRPLFQQSSATAPPLPLPRITIQHDFLAVVKDISSGVDASVEDTWVSCYLEGSSSVHGKVRVSEGDAKGSVEFTPRDGVEVEMMPGQSSSLLIGCPALQIPLTPVHFALSTPFTLRGGIDVFDISPTGSRAVIGGKDGAVRIVDLQGSAKSLELKGHVGDIRDAKFFPSGEVVLTSSSDMQLKVFSALDGTNPRTLIGHTKAVTSISILGIGKTVASASTDGTVRLWTVGSASLLATIAFPQPITAMVISEFEELKSEGSSYPDVPPGLLAIVAHSNGTASLFPVASDLKGDRPVRTLVAGSSPLYAVAFHPARNLVALGGRDGTVSLFDLSTSTSDIPFLSFRRSTSAILSLSFCPSSSLASPSAPSTLLISGADGLPFRVSIGLEERTGEVKVKEEFAGLDCDAAVAKEAAGFVWLAAADGKLRKYGGEVRSATT